LWADAEAKDWFNSGKRAFECTKLMMSANIYTLLRTYGPRIFTANVETLYGLAENLTEQLRSRTDFDLAVEPQANIVCFRYVGAEVDAQQLDQLNTQIRTRLVTEGAFYIVQTTIRGRVYLRVSLMNPLTTSEHLTRLLDEIVRCANVGVTEWITANHPAS
jgi:L-2,4-diaminobutyrate decarboxylase